MNLDNFMKALEEEAKAAAEFFGDGEAGPEEPAGKGRPPTDVVTEIRKGKGINWALFSVPL